MPNAFPDIAFTPAVKAARQLDGSHAAYARNFEPRGETLNQFIDVDLMQGTHKAPDFLKVNAVGLAA